MQFLCISVFFLCYNNQSHFSRIVLHRCALQWETFCHIILFKYKTRSKVLIVCRIYCTYNLGIKTQLVIKVLQFLCISVFFLCYNNQSHFSRIVLHGCALQWETFCHIILFKYKTRSKVLFVSRIYCTYNLGIKTQLVVKVLQFLYFSIKIAKPLLQVVF